MPFAAIWMDREMIILSEVRQRQVSYDIVYMWNLKKKKKIIQMNLFAKQKQNHRHRKQTWLPKGKQEWEAGERDKL